MADKEIENKLGQRLGGYQEIPPPAAWDVISKGLRLNNSPKWPWVAAILLLLVIGGGTWYVMSGEGQQSVKDGEREKMSSLEENDNSNQEVTESSNKLPIEDVHQDRVSENEKLLHDLEAERLESEALNDSGVNELVMEDQKVSEVKDRGTIAPQQNELNKASTINVSTTNQSVIKDDGEFGERDNQSIAVGQIKLKEASATVKVGTLPSDLFLLQSKGHQFASLQLPHINIVGVQVPTINQEREVQQTQEKVKRGKKPIEDRKLTFYFQGMPTFNYNRIEANQNDDLIVDDIEKVSALSTDRVGFRLETGLSYEMNERFSMMAGLLYFRQHQQIRYAVNVLNDVSTTIEGNNLFITPDFTQQYEEYDYNLENLGLQLGLLYQFKSQKFNSFLGSGIEFHRSLINPTDERFEQADQYVFFNLFYRMEYPKDTRLRFMTQPTFNYSIDLHESIDAPFYINPYGLGLYLGFTFKL